MALGARPHLDDARLIRTAVRDILRRRAARNRADPLLEVLVVERIAAGHVARVFLRGDRERDAVGQRRALVLGAEGVEVGGEGEGGRQD